MIEHEESSVKLKSEIVLLQRKLDTSDETQKKKIAMMKSKIEEDVQAGVSNQVKELQSAIKLMTQKHDNQMDKNKRLANQLEELQTEFKNYKEEKYTQEKQGKQHLKNVEK